MNKTKTIIRRWPGTRELIALFPEIPGDDTGHSCSTYMFAGRYGVTDVDRIVRQTEPLRWIGPPEQTFLDHLALIGYDIDLCFRHTNAMAKARRLRAEARR
jgi:hypothetical protein